MTVLVQSLQELREYWSGAEVVFAAEEIARIDKVLKDPPSLTDAQLIEFFDRLSGEEFCNFREGPNGMTWDCAGGNDKTYAITLLMDMGVDANERERLLNAVDVLGGHCDCEIIFNAESRILGG